ncbi:MAG: peptidyl-prolyl cis-trans isomerase C [Nitrospirae bacterium]|nr:MAG: peptidyl-prolyl cis-trans isomerase C [Nitrospirota bacterium]
MLRILVISVLVLFFYTLSATRYPLSPDSYTLCFAGEKKIAASVNGENISEAEVQMAVNRLMPAGSFHGRLSDERTEQLRKSAVDSLIEKELLYQEGKRLGISVKKSEVKEIFNKNKEAFKKKKDFYSALEKMGLTEDSYRRLIEKELISRKFIKQEVEDKIRLSEANLEDYYNKNKGKFVSPDRIRVREMSINVSPTATQAEREEKKKQAEDLLKRVKAGEDFAALAYKYSEDDYRMKAGDLGLSHKGRLMQELEEAAYRLNIGEVSGLIETIYGYHIIRLEEKKPEEQLDFAGVKDSLKKELEGKRYKEAREALIKALKEKAVISIK